MIKELLTNKDSVEKATIKARELSKEKLREFSMDGYDVTITDFVHNGTALTMNLSVKKDGKDIQVSNPFNFVNPFILVPDGTTKIVKSKLGDELIDAEVNNYVEDPEKAIKLMIIHTLKTL